MKVLIAYDGSAHADAAIDHAVRLFPGVDACVVTVWGSARPAATAGRAALPDDVIVDAVTRLDGAREAEARATAEAGAGRAAAAGMSATALAVRAEPNVSSGVLGAAEERGADVVVVGSRGRSGIRSALLGSVSNAIVHHSRRPVLVVPDDAG